MAEPKSFSQLVTDIAMRKVRAAHARHRPNPDAEKPRDVTQTVCAAIGAQLESDGFSYVKSGPYLKRSAGDFTFNIRFQSDRNNVAGEYVGLIIYAGVRSRSLAEWQRNHADPYFFYKGPSAGNVTGAQIGNLTADAAWLQWNFADQATRQSRIDDAVATIRRLALPFFGEFEVDPAGCIERLITYRALLPVSLLRYALSQFGKTAAETAVRAFLNHTPDYQESFESDLARFRMTPPNMPGMTGNIFSDVAAFSVAADLDL